MKAAVVINGAGEVLIEQRPDNGLLAKLWQFPNMEEEADDVADLSHYLTTDCGLSVNLESDVKQYVKHVFSHLIWEIDVFSGAGEVIDGEKFSKTKMKFVNKEDVDWYPFPVSHQKIIDEMVKRRALRRES